MSPDEKIAAIAAGQHGVFTVAQARRARLTRNAIAGRRASGRWISMYRGVYLLAGAPPTWEQSVIAAVFSCGPEAVASGATAGVLWGLIEKITQPLHVTIPLALHRERRPGIVLHRATLTRSDLKTRNGIRTTAPNRTLVDLAAILEPTRLEAALDTALLRGLTSLVSLHRYICDRRLDKRRGIGTLRCLIDDRTKGIAESELERIFLRKLRASGLPEPIRQFPVGRRRVDMAFPDRHVAIELDGLGSRFTGPSLRADRRRQNEIELALPGWTLLRFTWEDVTHNWPSIEGTLREVVV